VSSRRFQPADNIAMRITPTPTGLTGSPALPGPIQFFCHVSVGSTHGYSRFAPLGQFPPRHFVLIGDFDGTLESALTGRSALTLPGSRVVEQCPRGAADQTMLERSKTRLWGVYSQPLGIKARAEGAAGWRRRHGLAPGGMS
jgi:hypothetical protein